MKAYISENANSKIIEYIRSKGFDIEFVRKTKYVSEPISSHPDIYYCDLGKEIYKGDETLLSNIYPGDVLYNAARIGNHFVCSKYTSKDLIEKAKSLGLKNIYVRQGYVKCNICILDDTHVITEDEGIAKALQNEGINVLLIRRGHVKLDGFDYGFIGGATLKCGDEILFNGAVTNHPDYEIIKMQIDSLGLRVKAFDYPLADIGSIFLEK